MPLSILSVLGETLTLWGRHWRLFLLMAAFLCFPALVIGNYHHRGELTGGDVARNAARIVFPAIFEAIGIAATLSLFARPSPDKPWLVMVRGVRGYTGQLVGVQVLLCLLAIVLMVPIMMLIWATDAIFDSAPVGIILGELIFLIFLKYALANPLVVAENFTAASALEVSWRMTRHRFVFVFGCYLIVGITEWVLNYSMGYVALHLGVPNRGWAEILFLSRFLNTYWFVLAWVMYRRIKTADDRSVEPAAPVYP
jgi:hypothetical protein